MQQHRATRLHYDFRLEMDGVLRSWAVPRGPSLDPTVKRLAVRTEDHPVDYGDFEGVIPEGNYGAGSVIIWDRGDYEMLDPANPQDGFEQGKLHFRLRGEKLGGEWILVRTGREEREWLLFKARDAYASPGGGEVTGDLPRSVVSGLTLAEIGSPDAAPRQWHVGIERALEDAGVKVDAARSGMPGDMGLMLATPAPRAPEAEGWIYEIKLDGVRAQVRRGEGGVEIRSRSGKRLDGRFPALARALGQLPADSFVLDGEIVRFDEGGRSRFSLIQQRLHLSGAAAIRDADRNMPAWYSAFDLLYVSGYDLRQRPLTVRKAILRALVSESTLVRFVDDVEGSGAEFLSAVESLGLEGILAKKKASRYVAGRSKAWLKVKTTRTDDFVVLGFTPPSGARRHFGALLLGQYETGRRLVYVGRVGTGFDEAGLADAGARLRRLSRKTAPLQPVPGELDRVHWTRPALVAEVRFAERTPDGKLRAQVFVRFREDKSPEECLLPDPDASEQHPVSEPDAPSFPPTNAGKVFWPGEGITKGDLVAYYSEIESVLAPHLEDRPLVLKRYPDGIRGEHFFQKRAPDHLPDWVRTETIASGGAGRAIRYVIGCDRGLLPFLANLGTITQNPWSSRVRRLDHPDYVVFDLDPSDGVAFGDVRRVALELRRVLAELDLEAYPKTSGASGIHVFLPLLADRFTYRDARRFATAIASVVVERLPRLATMERSVARRPKGVYIDCLQNARGQTVASVYSARARPGAPVSAPVRWEELRRRFEPDKHTVRTMPKRIRRVGDLFRGVLEDRQDISPFLEALRDLG